MPLRWFGLDFPFPLQGALPGLLHLLLPVLQFFFFFSSSSLSPSLQFDYYHIKHSHQPCFDYYCSIPYHTNSFWEYQHQHQQQPVSQAKHTASPRLALPYLRYPSTELQQHTRASTSQYQLPAHHLPPQPPKRYQPSASTASPRGTAYTHPRYTQHHKPPAVLADPDQPTQDGFHGTIRLPRASPPRLPPVHARAASDALDVAVCPLGRLHQLPSS